MNRFLTSAALVLAAASMAGSAGAASAGPACSFEVPAQWSREGTRWDGECSDGRAHGLGVLKEYRNGSVAKFFFGRLRGGQPILGVIDQPEGYVAGTFRDGRAVPSEERQATISAFTEAEKAAKSVSDRFRKAGNGASTEFYRNKARELREQMD
jgi:hypothetical protein